MRGLYGVLLLGILFTWGCATPTQEIAPLKPGFYDLRTQRLVSEDALRQDLKSSQYVLVGESHDNQADHALQAQVYAWMLSDGRVALGMEMFQRPFQPHLDAFLAQDLDEEAMLVATEYEKRWGFETKFYSPLWNAARQSKSPLVALNVRRELTKRVSAVGLEGLSTWERTDLPDIDEGPQAYADWLKRIFEGHGMNLSPERFRRFFQAQLLWDETMAETAWTALHASDVDRMFIAVGRGHVERRWGVASRIERRDSQAKVTTIVSISRFESLESLAHEALADYVVVGPE